MIEMKESVDIRPYSTFKVGGQFRYFTSLSDAGDLPEVCEFAKEKNLPIFVLGGGSNMVFPDGVFESVVIKINFLGFEIINDDQKFTDIKIYSGENWDSTVERIVKMGLSGIEAMSAIPGTVGATPVQNVGAYGQEIKDTLLSVDVFDMKANTFKTLSNNDCNFSYRDSIFKHSDRGRYVIIAVTLHLSKDKPSVPNYHSLKKYFIENNINNPSLTEIREAVKEIRKNKLPDPKEIFNVGSFFKNPIVPKVLADKLISSNTSLAVFTIDEDHTKIPAGWLIENAGLKGHNFGTISVYENNALVLVNNGNATRSDVEEVKRQVIENVFNKYGIKLEVEPEFV